MFSDGSLHIDMQVLRTYPKQWMIETIGMRELGKSELAVWCDGDDNNVLPWNSKNGLSRDFYIIIFLYFVL